MVIIIVDYTHPKGNKMVLIALGCINAGIVNEQNMKPDSSLCFHVLHIRIENSIASTQ